MNPVRRIDRIGRGLFAVISAPFLVPILTHNPFTALRRRPVLDVVACNGLGDTLMCTPALRALKRTDPECSIRFYTGFDSLVRGLPYIDKVLPPEAAPSHAPVLDYDRFIPPRLHLVRLGGRCRALKLPALLASKQHISRMIGALAGVAVWDVRPDCIIDPNLVARWRHKWRDLPRPHILVSRHSGGWFSNKDWPESYWEELIARLAGVAGVIETGLSPSASRRAWSGHYVDLRGRTTVDEFVAAIAAADIHVGPISGPIHVAAAAATPCVVIYGGLERPSNTAYPGNIALAGSPSCAPCWLREPCPYGRECLTEISPDQVEGAIWHAWGRQRRQFGDSPAQKTAARE